MNFFKKIEKTMMAAAIAEAGKHKFGKTVVTGKNVHKKVLLGTDCPEITAKILDHSLELCNRLGSSLEIFQLISPEAQQITSFEVIESGINQLRSLKNKLNKIGIEYEYAIRNTLLEEEMANIAKYRRDILAVIVPNCGQQKESDQNFQSTIIQCFKCPVVFFES